MLDYLASLCLMRVAIINHLFFFFLIYALFLAFLGLNSNISTTY